MQAVVTKDAVNFVCTASGSSKLQESKGPSTQDTASSIQLRPILAVVVIVWKMFKDNPDEERRASSIAKRQEFITEFTSRDINPSDTSKG